MALSKHHGLDFIGSLQPQWPHALQKDYSGTFLTRRRKLKVVQNWRRNGAPALPMCIEHAGANRRDFVVPPKLVVGFVTGMFLDSNDNLCITGHVFGNHPASGSLIYDMLHLGKKWGLSPFTIFDTEPDDPLSIIDDSKVFTHVGITLTPAMAKEGSYIFEYSTNPEAIPRIMREREIPNGAVANEASMTMWGVHPTVMRSVSSILEKHILTTEAGDDISSPSSSTSSVPMSSGQQQQGAPLVFPNPNTTLLNQALGAPQTQQQLQQNQPFVLQQGQQFIPQQGQQFAPQQQQQQGQQFIPQQGQQGQQFAPQQGQQFAPQQGSQFAPQQGQQQQVPQQGQQQQGQQQGQQQQVPQQGQQQQGQQQQGQQQQVPQQGQQQQQVPQQQQQQQQQQKQKPADDPMTGVTSESNDLLMTKLIEGIKGAHEQVGKIVDDIEKEAAITVTIDAVNKVLKENKLKLQTMPWEFSSEYFKIKNEGMAINEKLTTSLLKLGNPANGNNQASIAALKNPTTSIDQKRQIAQYVAANNEVYNTQKVYEAKFQEQIVAREAEKRSYEEQLNKKRDLEKDVEELRKENEQLKKHRPESGQIRVPVAGYNFFPSSFAGQQQQQQQQQQLPQQSIAKANGYNFYTPQSSSQFSQNEYQNQYPGAEAQRAAQYPLGGTQIDASNFVSASGFQLRNDEVRHGNVDPKTWLTKFILPSSDTSFAQGENDPAFLETYQNVSRALTHTGIGMNGKVFGNITRDAENLEVGMTNTGRLAPH